jgi:putative transposase
VGVDLGTGEVALSDERFIQAPRPYKNMAKRLRRAQKALARKQKGSKNRAKARARVNKIHGRIADIRSDWTHKTTTMLVREYTHIAIEDLSVKGMSSSAKGTTDKPGKNVRQKSGLNKSILDANMGEFRRQLEYKARENGTVLEIVDRWFPSSKTCSTCGEKTNLINGPGGLKVRVWTCGKCNTTHHRDTNAAINLKHHAFAGSSSVAACGEFSDSGDPGLSRERPAPSAKQEPNTRLAWLSLSTV